jgi:hypothetical protein
MQEISSSIKHIALQLAMIRAVEVELVDEDEQEEKVENGKNSKSSWNNETSSSTLSPTSVLVVPTTPDKPERKTIPPSTPTESSFQYRKTANHVKQTMVRWVNLAHALAVRDLFEQYPNEFSDVKRLQNLGFITEEESKHLQTSFPSHDRYGKSTISNKRQLWDSHRPFDIPIAWAYEWINQLDQSDHFQLAPVVLSILNSTLVNLRENLDVLFMYRDTPVPLFYRQLVTFTVRMYMIIFLIGDGIMALQNVVDIAIQEVVVTDIDGGTTTTEVFNQPPLSALLKTAYYMLIPFAFEYFVFVG